MSELEFTRSTRCQVCEEAFHFSYVLPEDMDEDALLVEMKCKWCEAELEVDLSQYTTLEMFRNAQGNPVNNDRLDIPDEIPAQPHSTKHKEEADD